MFKVLLFCLSLVIPHSAYSMEHYTRQLPSALTETTKKDEKNKPILFTLSAPEPEPTQEIKEKEKQPRNRSISPQSKRDFIPKEPVPQELKKKQTRTISSRSLSPQSFFQKTTIDPQTKEEDRARKRAPLKSSLGISITRSDSPSKKTTSPQISPGRESPHKSPRTLSVMQAIRNGEIDVVQGFLAHSDSNPNSQDERKNTPLHLATIGFKEEIAILFLRDPRTNSLIKNSDNYAPYQFITGPYVHKYPKLHTALIHKAQLDHIIDALLMMHFNEFIDRRSSDRATRIKRIEFLCANIPSMLIPDYADSEFILAAIEARLRSELSILQIMHDIYASKPTLKDEWGTNALLRALYMRKDNFFNQSINNPNRLCPDTGKTSLDDMIDACNEPLITLLITHPCINTIANKSASHQRITKDAIINYPTLYDALKRRDTLEFIIRALMVTHANLLTMQCKDVKIDKAITNLLTKICPKRIPTYATLAFMHAMIRARLMYDLPELQEICQNYKKNPNYQDPEWGCTLSHQAVYLGDKERIKELVKNPHVNTLKRNTENFFPQSLLDSLDPHTSEIRTILFARDSLERWIAKILERILWTNPTIDPSTITITDKCIQDAIKKIRSEEEKIKRNQGDAELPSEVDMPSYADDQFIFNALVARIKERKPTNLMPHFIQPIDISPRDEVALVSPRPTLEEDVMQAIEDISIAKLHNDSSDEDTTSLSEFLNHS